MPNKRIAEWKRVKIFRRTLEDAPVGHIVHETGVSRGTVKSYQEQMDDIIEKELKRLSTGDSVED